jgi:hypothetical protein
MSEVKRYYIGAYSGEAEARTCSPNKLEIIHQDEGRYFYLDEDFDRVTAERDAALGREAALLGDVAASKQLLEATRDALEAAQYLNKEVAGRVSECEKLFSDLVNSPHAVAVPVHFWKRIKEFSAVDKPAECCTVSAEDQALLDAGDYTPEELFGIGGKPSCPKCAP